MSKTSAQAGRPKTRYQTRNWQEYNRGLIARGDLTVWISPALVWHATEGNGRRGRPPVFTDAAIQCVLTLKVLFQRIHPARTLAADQAAAAWSC